MQIVNIFYDLARQHTVIKGFYYGGQRGAGNSVYPLVWLDDPLNGQASGAVASWSVNFDVLGIPVTDAEISTVQGEAFNAGLALIEKLKAFPPGVLQVERFSYITLRNYYDDNAAGVRFTVNLAQPIPGNLCIDYFDPLKQFTPLATLPDFATDNPEGCAVFTDGALPNFNINE